MSKTKTTEQFIKESRQLYGNKYDYTKTIYTNNKSDVTIICPIHGEFKQNAYSHLTKCGCKKCNSSKYNTDSFIGKANKLHDNKYTYSKTVCYHNTDKVIITCPVHGDFTQEARNHIRGQGCPKCANERKGSWHLDDWKLCENHKNFDGFKLYIIRCWNDKEEFYKIGKTARKLHERFAGNRLPYEWELVKEYRGSAEYIHELEETLHKYHNDFKYTPKIVFCGSTKECFSEYKK